MSRRSVYFTSICPQLPLSFVMSFTEPVSCIGAESNIRPLKDIIGDEKQCGSMSSSSTSAVHISSSYRLLVALCYDYYCLHYK